MSRDEIISDRISGLVVGCISEDWKSQRKCVGILWRIQRLVPRSIIKRIPENISEGIPGRTVGGLRGWKTS